MKHWLRPILVGLLLPVIAGCVTPPNRPHNYARWEKAIHAFEQSDVKHPPAKGVVVVTGSSTIVRWKTLARDFPSLPVLNRGFGGSEIVDATHFADRIIFPYAPKMVWLRAGGNDLWAGKTPSQVADDFKAFAETVHAQLPASKLVFISLSPSLARWKQHEAEKELNTRIAGYIADKPWLQYVETYDVPLGANGLPRPELFVSDKLHFNAAGYQLLAARVRSELQK